MSLTVLGLVLAKVMIPSGKAQGILGFVFAILIMYIFAYVSSSVFESMDFENLRLASSIVDLVCGVLAYFATAYLVDNKLEIYN